MEDGVTGPEVTAVVFAAAVAALAVLLCVVAVRYRRWPEVGMCSASAVFASFLAVLAATPVVPLWLVLVVAWCVVVLLAVAVWSVVRGVEKARTGEDTR